MNPEPSTSPKSAFALPLILTVLPAIGSLVGAVPQLQPLIVLAFFASPFLSLVAGIILGCNAGQSGGGKLLRQYHQKRSLLTGCNTGQSVGGKILYSILWTVGSLTVSLLLQGAGCSLTNFNPRL